MCVVGIDFEGQIERSARSNDSKILIEHNERFSNRVDDCVRKYPGILDLGELSSEHVSEHGWTPGILGRESTELSVWGAPIRCLRWFHHIPTMYGRRRYLMPLKGAKPFILPKIDAHFGSVKCVRQASWRPKPAPCSPMSYMPKR